MTRPLRIEFAGALYHVMSRGNERQRIVRDDADWERRLEWLRRAVQTYGWRLHSFVLMTTHDHLFVETPEPNLSAGIHLLNGSYTGYFNRRHRRVGHLFQGRFKAHLIDEEGYYLEISRSIHLNPVRAKMAGRPEEYRWSSYRGYKRAAWTVEWVTYDRVLGEFGGGEAAARRAYTRFVGMGMEGRLKSPWAGALGGLIVGSDGFAARVGRLLGKRPADGEVPQLERLRQRPSLERIIEEVGRHFGREQSGWSAGTRSDDASRAVAAYLARRRFGYPAGTVASALGYRSHGSIHSAIARVECGGARLRPNDDITGRLELGWDESHACQSSWERGQ
jgi:REP element-mobilizing transposase RayT